jgi:hypothetical protein
MKVSVNYDRQAKQFTICVTEIELEKMLQGNFYKSELGVQQIINRDLQWKPCNRQNTNWH